jgi:hypothetical protein
MIFDSGFIENESVNLVFLGGLRVLGGAIAFFQ